MKLHIRWHDHRLDEFLQRESFDDRWKATERAADAAKAAAPGDQGRTIKAARSGLETAVVNTSSFWHLVEFGSINNPAYAPMRRGVESVLDYRNKPR